MLRREEPIRPDYVVSIECAPWPLLDSAKPELLPKEPLKRPRRRQMLKLNAKQPRLREKLSKLDVKQRPKESARWKPNARLLKRRENRRS